MKAGEATRSVPNLNHNLVISRQSTVFVLVIPGRPAGTNPE